MSGLVLDCSMTMAWCFEDESDAQSDAVLDALQQSSAWVPALWHLEVANVLLVAERKHRVSSADSTRFLALLGALPIQTDDTRREDVMALGRAHGLSAYDACYLELSRRRGLPLATRDARLMQACEKEGVPLFGLVSTR